MPTNYKNESVERLTRIALLVTAALLVLLCRLASNAPRSRRSRGPAFRAHR